MTFRARSFTLLGRLSRVPWTALAIAAFLPASLHAGLTALVSSPVVQPGGTAQITVVLASPAAITYGRFQIDADPAVFGDITAIHIFSASGDQQGVARLQGRHAEVVFAANSGGIGRLPSFPVAEITVPVLATAPAGGKGTVAVQAPAPWREVSGRLRTVSFQSPGVRRRDVDSERGTRRRAASRRNSGNHSRAGVHEDGPTPTCGCRLVGPQICRFDGPLRSL